MPTIPTSSSRELDDELTHLASTRTFGNAGAPLRLLRFLLSNSEDGSSLKETHVGTVFYGRQATFDPRYDSIVRTNVSRLRQRLEEYYAGEGSDSKAEAEAQQALNVAEATGNISDILAASSELGQVQASFPNPRAKDTLQHALDIAQRAGALMSQSSLLLALGNLADDDENYSAERDYNQKALDITLREPYHPAAP